ncbi:MAG: GntR family transcriptional regulator [Cyanobacteria bacterium P01_D01_bin.1]
MSKLQLGNFKQVSRTTQATVTEHLRQAILLGKLPGGTRLVQSELAAAFNVSVTPIREALRELSAQGLIELDAFKGAVVRMPTLAELEEVYELRSVLIPLSVRKSINCISLEQFQKAEAVLDQMEATTDEELWVDLNRSFHNILDDVAQTPLLKQTLKQLSDLSATYINLSFGEQPSRKGASEKEHRDILQAYADKDEKLAIQLVLLHLNGTLNVARAALTR